MRQIREHLSWLLSLWLTCQLVALAAPAVLMAAGSAPVAELCTCPGGDHETCPMHHGSSTTQAAGSVCEMRAACAPVDLALLSMAGGAGVLPAPLSIAQPQHISVLALTPYLPLDTPAPHDTPPPRS